MFKRSSLIEYSLIIQKKKFPDLKEILSRRKQFLKINRNMLKQRIFFLDVTFILTEEYLQIEKEFTGRVENCILMDYISSRAWPRPTCDGI